MPYSTAATCLHIDAQSGQLQVKRISFGDGNSPVFSSQRRVMTPFEKRPCRSSTSESMAPAQSSQMALQRVRGTGATVTFTSYIVDPLTSAATLPGATCKSTTDPLRTYVLPRGSRFAKSL